MVGARLDLARPGLSSLNNVQCHLGVGEGVEPRPYDPRQRPYRRL